jgi:Rrf2 family protein
MLLPKSLSFQIISKLAQHQLINTFPGRNGGIQLAHPPEDITLYQVVNLMEGPLVISECLEDGHNCELSPRCPVQGKWIHLQKVIQYELQAISFKLLLDESAYMQKILSQ